MVQTHAMEDYALMGHLGRYADARLGRPLAGCWPCGSEPADTHGSCHQVAIDVIGQALGLRTPSSGWNKGSGRCRLPRANPSTKIEGVGPRRIACPRKLMSLL
jgi:hypothetical protein